MTMFNNSFVQLYQADARSLPIPDDSVDCVVTSPPYWGLRDYGLYEQGIGLEPTPEEYCTNMVKVFREVWRVLKPTGTVWLNLGDSYTGSGVHPGGGAIQKGNIGATNTTLPPKGGKNLKSKDLVGIPWRVAFALQADGWYLRSDIIWSKPNPMPESVQDRPTKAHEYVFLLTKSPRYYYDADAIRETYAPATLVDAGDNENGQRRDRKFPGNPSVGGTNLGGLRAGGRNKRSVWEIPTHPYPEAHFATYPEKLVEPCILAGSSEKGVCAECGKPWERTVERESMQINRTHNHPEYLRTRTSGTMTKPPSSTTTGWHPTCDCNASIVPATVLDPFVGSGTTMAVAQRLGRRGIGTDLSEAYLKLAIKRLTAIPMPMPMRI
jgi:DNA modification methylase